ncbi:MAG: DMT family transporter [Chloroflexota bacterium]
MNIPTTAHGVAAASQAAHSAGVSSRPLDLAGFGLIMLATLLASSQGIAVKFGLSGISPYTLLALRCILALLVLLVIVRLIRAPWPSGRTAWAGAFVLGTFQVAVAGCIYFWALQYIPVGRATIITSTQPFLTVVAAHFLIPGDRITRRKVAGLCLGFLGVLVVVLGRGGDLGSQSVLADVGLLVAAVMWTGCSVLVKYIGPRWHMMALVTAQMGAAAVVSILAAVFLEPQRVVVLTPFSVGGLVYLATVGSVAAFFVTFYVIRRYEVSLVSSFIFLQPILGVLLGALILGEVVTPNIVLSLALTVAGLTIVNRKARGK